MKVVYALPMQDIPYKSATQVKLNNSTFAGYIKISNSENAILKIGILLT
jgi:hypothetical protein